MNKIQTARTVFLLLASFVFVTGCTETVSIHLEPKVDAYLVTNSAQAIPVVETDPAHIELNTWLRENQTGWHNTSGRFPGGVYIKSGNDGIQVTGMEVVIYTLSRGEPDARYVKNVGKKELPFVRAIGQ